MIFNRDSGHTLTGGDTGAEGINGILEQNLTRQLGVRIDKLLQLKGHVVNDITIDKTEPGYVGLCNSINKRVSLCNQNKADFNIVLHFNKSFDKDGDGDGDGYGSEIFTYQAEKLPEAIRILNNFKKIGLRNRGIKDGKDLGLVVNTNDPTIYIEVLFIDNKHDYKILETKGLDVLAEAIVSGILNEPFDFNKKPKREAQTIINEIRGLCDELERLI